MATLLTAKETVELLEISLPTLYAYVSRGQLRSEPVPGKSRERRYRRDDVLELVRRKETRRNPSKSGMRNLHFGGPVLSSGITLIQDGRLFYAGQDALELAKYKTLEEIAALLWKGEESLLDEGKALNLRRPQLAIDRRARGKITLEQMQIALALGGAADPAAYDLRRLSVQQTGRRILRLLASAVTEESSGLPLHLTLQQAWARKNITAANAIRAALVLCADHELNVSAFAARCAASAGASPYDVVLAGMCALKGRRHGGQTEKPVELMASVESARSAQSVIAERLRRGEHIPGFGHPLYPEGDPRASYLLSLLYRQKDSARSRLVRSLAQAGAGVLGEHPNLDFALAAVSHCFGFPKGAALALFGLGRTVGWIAHAIEQYESGDLIRPRAQYTGPVPEGL